MLESVSRVSVGCCGYSAAISRGIGDRDGHVPATDLSALLSCGSWIWGWMDVPVTNLKGMVTRSSSSDMFAVVCMGGWWVSGVVLRGSGKSSGGGREAKWLMRSSSSPDFAERKKLLSDLQLAAANRSPSQSLSTQTDRITTYWSRCSPHDSSPPTRCACSPPRPPCSAAAPCQCSECSR
jgi:hypothetical protein